MAGERRFATYISILPFTKDLTYDKFCSDIWPLERDEKREKKVDLDMPVMTTELWVALKKQMRPKKTEYEKILEKHKQT